MASNGQPHYLAMTLEHLETIPLMVMERYEYCGLCCPNTGKSKGGFHFMMNHLRFLRF